VAFFRRSLAAYSCGGSHGFEVHTVFPFHSHGETVVCHHTGCVASVKWRSNLPFSIKQANLCTIPPARLVFQYFVGTHLLMLTDGQGFVLNFKAHHQNLVTLLG
jgi:hypothetical protein